MLKITTIEAVGERRLLLEGKLIEPWLAELKRAWQEARSQHRGNALTIDLENITVISEQGQAVLFEMMSQGAEFVGCGVLTKHVLQQLARRCKTDGCAAIGGQKTQAQ